LTRPLSPPALRSLATGALLAILVGCQAAAPRASVESPSGRVRAEREERAREVAALLEDLKPRIGQHLPDAHSRAREVWIQERPQLYLFSGTAYEEADGFWSETHGRIHLREDAQSLSRTLAHELVHSSLGESWEVLPGTIEEGLCDVVSVLLCPEDAWNMRTGRLSAAAFATGGLELEVELFLPAEVVDGELQIGCLTRMRLQGRVREAFDPADVFEVAAGLSTTQLPTNDKKALYGLSYLLVDRVVERVGFRGLHELCLRTERLGLPEVPAEWLLEAAEMESGDVASWRRALQEAIGRQELEALVQLYPELISDSAGRVFGPRTAVRVDRSGVAPVAASVRVAGGDAALDLRLRVQEEVLARAETGAFRE